ncbi:hypothetical protein RI367_006706 [Sorochytrium milnesiophthora]
MSDLSHYMQNNIQYLVQRSMRQHVQTTRRAKTVCCLKCRHCDSQVCARGMKAILLADAGVELFSTDAPPMGVALVNEDYTTQKCLCKIRDGACLTCGNIVGYHVTQPCKPCLESCNNGHFWMFHMENVAYWDRYDDKTQRPVLWSMLPAPDQDTLSDRQDTDRRHAQLCR